MSAESVNALLVGVMIGLGVFIILALSKKWSIEGILFSMGVELIIIGLLLMVWQLTR